MHVRLLPEIGGWYRHLDKGLVFQVVALDEHDGIIEIQDIDGDLDEMDLAQWRGTPLAAAAPPEDTRGSLDEDEFAGLDAAGERDDGTRHWRDPLDALPASPAEEPGSEEEDEAAARS